MFRRLGLGEGCTLTDTPELLAVESPILRPPYNIVLRFYDDQKRNTKERVAELVDRYRARGAPLVWLQHPTASPQNLDEALRAGGLMEVEELYGMTAPTAGLRQGGVVPDGVEMREATAADWELWAELVALRYDFVPQSASIYQEVFERSVGADMWMWVALIEGRAASKVVLHVSEGTAGLYGVATAEHARGRGLASALMAKAHEAASELGCSTCVLHSTPMARSLYRALGYRDVATFTLWADQPTHL